MFRYLLKNNTSLLGRRLKTPSRRRIGQDSIYKSSTFIQAIQRMNKPHLESGINQLTQHLDELNGMRSENDEDLNHLVHQEIKETEIKLKQIIDLIIEDLAVDKGDDVDQVFIDVEAAVGGQESMLFANEMLHMYEQLIIGNNWKYDLIEYQTSDLGGLRRATLMINGAYCYALLKHEAGIHRVQRVPKTERTGRMHTSTVAVSVIPSYDPDQNVVIDPKDIKIETMRSSGPGGQNVNKRESCVRIKHLPTGINVVCEDQRSQDNNKQTALKRLQQILNLNQLRSNQLKEMELKSQQVGSKERSDKIRTYNYAQDRITDHRLSENVYGIETFMKNPQKLINIIDKLQLKQKTDRINEIIQSFKQ